MRIWLVHLFHGLLFAHESSVEKTEMHQRRADVIFSAPFSRLALESSVLVQKMSPHFDSSAHCIIHSASHNRENTLECPMFSVLIPLSDST